MPTTSRRASLSVIEQLIENPQRFSFLQAVRLLERSSIYDNVKRLADAADNSSVLLDMPVARFSPPQKEAIRFSSAQDLSFPEAEVQAIEKKVLNNKEYWSLVVNFIGLTGSMGVLPYHYSELIASRLKQKDTSLRHFLNLFNHRTVSLFFQASTKYRLPLEYERNQLYKDSQVMEDNHTFSLLSLVGLGTSGLRNRQVIHDESLIYYSGLLTQHSKTEHGLQQLIQSYFNVPVKISGFIGQWQTLIEDVRTRLPSKKQKQGQNVCLGRSTMLGSKGWFAQGKSHIALGPLDKAQFDKFSPGSGALQALNQIAGSYLGMEQDFDLIIQVNRNNLPNKTCLQKNNPPKLAWNTWLSGASRANSSSDELLEITVSSKKLH